MLNQNLASILGYIRFGHSLLKLMTVFVGFLKRQLFRLKLGSQVSRNIRPYHYHKQSEVRSILDSLLKTHTEKE